MSLQTNDIVVAELYDLTYKRLWFKNYSIDSMNFDFNDLIFNIRCHAKEFLNSLDKDHKPLVPKYRLELKFLLEDISDAGKSNS